MDTQLPINKYFGTLTAADLRNSGDRENVGRENEKVAEESIYEKEDITHGHCDCCTSVEASEKFAEERAAAIRRLHAGRNERARQRKAGKQVEPSGNFPEGEDKGMADDWDPTMEDLDE